MAREVEELIQEGIERLRLKLLDLTNRNRLLNFKFTESSKKFVRVIDELPDVLYGRLTDDSEPKRLFFAALPKPPEDEGNEEESQENVEAAKLLPGSTGARARWRTNLRSRKRIDLGAWARSNGIDPSFDLPAGDESRASHHDSEIQTLLLPDDLEAKLSAIRDDQRLGQQELGISSLYAAFGFLEWYEADSSDDERFAPILLLPVEIDRQISRHKYEYFIKGGEGSEPTLNITLKERLLRDFKFAMPELNENEAPDSYLRRFAEAISGMPRWRVRRFMVIGHFSFSRLVMYMDLQSEKWQHSPLEQHPLVSSLLAGSKSSDADSGGDLAETLDVDSPDIEKNVPVLITDADSSQFSAIAAAMSSEKRSFAIKGPPGTGKSQTITNLIASALAQGKKVLFVAEKMAALSVVADRLSSAGLGDFLLELHSTKSQKKAVLESFASRIAHRASGSDEKLADSVSSLRRARDELKRYVDLMNSRVGKSSITLHEAYWREQRAQRMLSPDAYARVCRLRDADAVILNRDDVSSRCEVLRQLASDFKQCLGVRGSLAGHPLYGMEGPAEPFGEHSVRDAFGLLKDTAAKVAAVTGRISSATHASLPATFEGNRRIAEGLRRLPPATTAVDPGTLSWIRTKADIRSLEVLSKDIAALVKDLERISGVFCSILDVLKRAPLLGHSGVDLVQAMAELRIDDTAVSALPDLLQHKHAQLSTVSSLLGSLQQFWHASELPGDLSGPQVAQLLKAIALLRQVPEKVLRALSPQLFSKDARETLVAERAQSDEIRRRLGVLGAEIHLGMLPPPEKLLVYASALRGANFLTAILAKDCREALNLFKRASPKKGVSREIIADTFSRAASDLALRDRFLSQTPARSLAGALFNDLDTPYELMLSVNEFAARVRAEFSGFDPLQKPMQKLLLQGDPDALIEIASNATAERAAVLSDWLNQKGRRVTELPAHRVARELEVIDGAEGNLATVRSVALTQDMPMSVLGSELANAEKVAKNLRELTSSDLFKQVIGEGAYPAQSQVDWLNVTLSYAKYVLDLPLPQEMLKPLVSHRYQSALDSLSKFGVLLSSALSEFDEQASVMQSARGLSLERWLQLPIVEATPELVVRKAEDVLGLPLDSLSDWISLCRSREEALKYGLGSLVPLVEQGVVGAALAEEAYRAVYFRSLIFSVVESVQEFPRWTGERMSAVRKRLASLDNEYVEASRKWLAWKLSKAQIPQGISYGAVSEKTDLALITHEAGKQRAHRPLRELLRRAGGAARALKPCFMMSPASVAQFLDPGSMGFDLMIIDEASQMRPEEAIGSLARASQAIVVGDPQQLPPTSFFDGADESADEPDEEKVDVDTESVLDQALSSWRPHRELNWHYRSRHHSLIAFSNKEFYGGRLVVFPSPASQSARFGIDHVYVETGTYASSLNPVEANAVVEQVKQLIRTRPENSIGVVAINQAQQQLLKDLLDREFAQDDQLEAFRAKRAGTLEEFFVKNLENVQGDERDIIVISTVYGPPEVGARVAQRFGPINSKTGHRRLNVLFTRAKEKVVLITSMKAEDVLTSATTLPGVKALKGYLEYARSGRLEQGDVGTGRSPDSPFEEEVAEVIRQLGYKAEPQVGVAGYFIDMAVRHPVKLDHFVLGIECDGATYHSARSARDRDRLREEALLRLDWQLHRIWSTDWFTNREREVSKLSARIQSALRSVA